MPKGKNKINPVILLFFLVITTNIPPLQAVSEEVEEGIIWSDEFDGTELDAAKWEAMKGNRKDGYMDPEDAYLDGQGNLVMRIRRVSGDSRAHHGFIRTRRLYERRYGYFECRCIMPKEVGFWPAFWLLDGGMTEGGSGAEVDIMEYPFRNGKIQPVVHWNGYSNGRKDACPQQVPIPGSIEEYHTFGLLWTEDKYIWYIDREPVFESTVHVSDWEAYIKLTIEVGAWAQGDISQATLPDYWLVDYVRVYDTNPTAVHKSDMQIITHDTQKQNNQLLTTLFSNSYLNNNAIQLFDIRGRRLGNTLLNNYRNKLPAGMIIIKTIEK
jgi:beta-glucanase (GH16 family)